MKFEHKVFSESEKHQDQRNTSHLGSFIHSSNRITIVYKGNKNKENPCMNVTNIKVVKYDFWHLSMHKNPTSSQNLFIKIFMNNG
jgi:hypothetical protein